MQPLRSALRPPLRNPLLLQPRLFLLRRNASSDAQSQPQSQSQTPPPPQSQPATPSPPPSPPPPLQKSFLRRNLAPVLLSSLALILGLGAGGMITHTLAPPAMPLPGTHEDGVLLADLEARADELFVVKVLRGKCLGVAAQLKGSGAEGWVEIIPRGSEGGEKGQGGGQGGGQEGGQGGKIAESRSMLSQLRGARGTGTERVFWDRGSGKLVAVVWFGAGTAGWPGVTHGGMLATALTEKLALADYLAVHGVEERGGIGVEEAGAGMGRHARAVIPPGVVEAPRQPEELSLTYKRPTFANEFYVIRVTPAWRTGMGEEEEAQGRVGVALPVEGAADWEAAIETAERKVCVLAQARFPAVGSLVERAERRVVESTRRSYAEFRDWLWPSRQKESQIG